MQDGLHSRSQGVGVAAGVATRLAREYRIENGRFVRRRLALAATIYMAAISVYAVLDLIGQPSHARALAIRLGSHAVICGLGVLIASRWPTPTHLRWLAAGFAAAVTLAGSVYNAAVGTPAERYAMYLVCLLTGIAVLFPWGPGCQAVGAVASVAAFAAAAPWLTGAEGPAHGALALAVVSATTVAGAYYLDRSRLDAFVQTALQREEAEVTSALVRVGEMVSASLHAADMLPRVGDLARELLGSDATAVVVATARRDAFVPAAPAREGPDGGLAGAAPVRLSPGAPLFAGLVPGTVRELSGAAGAEAVPPGLVPWWDGGTYLLAPMWRGGELVGLMLHVRRAGPFTARERRLALGIAHTVAIGLENARLIADLQTANRLKSEFVSTVSHELRTPLNVILGFTEMARDGTVPPDERDRCLARVDASGRDLLHLIEDTLEIGRMDAGRDAVRTEPVALRALWAELGAAAAAMPRAAAVALVWSDAVPDVAVTTDPRKVTVIVRNLVGNALKFTAEGSVRADADLDGDALVLRVADTGIGIRPEDQEVIFEMFRQADGSDSRSYGGVGLGLHIVRRTVEQLGGTLRLESVRGRGSVFTVRLPVERAPLRRAA